MHDQFHSIMIIIEIDLKWKNLEINTSTTTMNISKLEKGYMDLDKYYGFDNKIFLFICMTVCSENIKAANLENGEWFYSTIQSNH